MKDLNINLKKRAGFFKEIGPSIAREMSKALRNLTAEKIKVEFSSVRTFDQSTVFVDVEEKCFGSCLNFKTSSPVRGSAFKETVNILILTYITGLANALEVELKMGVPYSSGSSIKGRFIIVF